MPKSLEDFLWSTSSPLNKIGLIESKKECNDIIWTSYTTPSLLKLHIDASIKATSQQLEYFSVCEGNAPFQKGTAVFEEFEKRFPRLTPQYLRSRQATNQIEIVNEFNYFLKYFVPFLLILCFILFFSEKIWSNERLRFFLIFIFLGIFLNAWLCSTLVYATNRYGTKMIWLIHLSFLLILVILFNKKHEFKDN